MNRIRLKSEAKLANLPSFTQTLETPASEPLVQEDGTVINWPALSIPRFGPRDVVLSRCARNTVLALRTVLAATALIGSAWTIQQGNRMEDLRTQGVQVTGTVSNRTVSKGKSTSYYLSYRYAYNSQYYEYRTSTDYNTYYSTRYGDPQVITLSPNNPTDCELGLVDRDRVEATQLNCSFGVLALCIVIGIASLAVRFAIRSQHRLLTHWECHSMYIVEATSVSADKAGRSYSLSLRCITAKDRGELFKYSVVSHTSPGSQGEFLTVLLSPAPKSTIKPLSTLTMVALREDSSQQQV